MKVTLDWYEIRNALLVGGLRHWEALRKGLKDRHGANPEESWSLHIEGAGGEIAVAKATGVYYAGSVNSFKLGGDVGHWQVRTRRKANYDLIVRHDDPDDSVFILVVGAIPYFEVIGWIMGRDAKKDVWLAGHGGRPPAYFVPRDNLQPIADLIRG